MKFNSDSNLRNYFEMWEVLLQAFNKKQPEDEFLTLMFPRMSRLMVLKYCYSNTWLQQTSFLYAFSQALPQKVYSRQEVLY